MFEQSLYEQAPVDQPAPDVQEGDLFHNYELKSWVPTPRLYKILGASALANILALLVVAQTSLLTMKGCDSPLVGSVCQVLDTVYMGSMLLGTQREYADAAYDRTQLSDMDITYVELPSESSKLQYPEGYFQLANPEQFVAEPVAGSDVPFPTTIPTYPGSPVARPVPGNSMFNTAPVYAKPKKDVVKGELPKGFGDNPTIAGVNTPPKKSKVGSNTPSNDPVRNADGSAVGTPGSGNTNSSAASNAKNPDDKGVPDQNGIPINKRPLNDKAAETLAELDAGKVRLDGPFRVSIAGTLGLARDGVTIVLKDPKALPVDKKFDPALTKLAQDWVLAVGDAGWYAYLGKLDEKKGIGRKVIITIEQDDKTFTADVRMEQVSPERAATAASSLSTLMTVGAFGANADQLDFLRSTKTSTDGKFLVVNFAMDKTAAQDMIKRKLAETKEKQSQPNSTAFVHPESNKLS